MTHQGQSCNSRNFRRMSGEKQNGLRSSSHMSKLGLFNLHLCSLPNELSIINITLLIFWEIQFPRCCVEFLWSVLCVLSSKVRGNTTVTNSSVFSIQPHERFPLLSLLTLVCKFSTRAIKTKKEANPLRPAEVQCPNTGQCVQVASNL